MEAREFDGIGAYMFPWHNGTRLTREEFQSFSDHAFSCAEIILLGESLGEPNAMMSYSDAVALLEGMLMENLNPVSAAQDSVILPDSSEAIEPSENVPLDDIPIVNTPDLVILPDMQVEADTTANTSERIPSSPVLRPAQVYSER